MKKVFLPILGAIFAILIFNFECRAEVRYADGFSVERGVVRATRPVLREYVLADFAPVRRFVSSSTTLLPYWEILGVKDGLTGQGWSGYVFEPGSISADDIGPGNNVNIEKILALAPDVAFLYASSEGELEVVRRLENLGVKVVLVGEYLETHPLGRVEWLAFLAPFFGDEAVRRAEKYISDTVLEYENLRKSVAEKILSRPEVLLNASWGGKWHVPGGRSLFVHFIRDSGGEYKLDTSDSTDGVPLDIETIFARAGQAEFWLNPSAWQSLSDGLREDSRYSLFRAFREGNVYNNTRRMRTAGGNDFHEGGVLKPHIILADMISILHPEILPNHEPVYYKKLLW